ncbi:SDR family NAD(P)-dependent oxidoreductase [Deinococcus metallilatus]|uniref:NAD(P)-dependent dehydrogenase (Short-subunit alcohol dehydrogenase family) n=1 Tax=Deinococcus metallilatus TaxID=1211322 RepID=A0AAJ5F4W1_9DEIO|nr:SDR family NAD(P)-dependent oxidoreductase [Deinococcus metallilatus]MBB5296223.1 NAD(P)-dependent dehydrogenase (short-subunit alcohol dehydrogenase family) [Deinococcus metallilatus]QBY09730.1 SDR family NAD(P)-dependent oxidoreductase [Deinococcus metallilatus]RXJ08928.1 SDR family NAD(P)-dependent oxidoreductase [Deinococcus metallilatus]TLK23693.1 SDR family oxidoreductase [Deinococcus metallilatus]GMA14089.1 short-chain dehydrogenase [Deinococcus metallilatus]
MTAASTLSFGSGPVLTGQVIAVTGADQGYGRTISAALARAGASVVLIGGNSESLAVAASGLELAGGTAIPIKADVGVPLDWLSAQNRILEIFGALHGIVHLADKRAHTNFTLLSESEWMELFNCNVKSSVAIAQIVRRRLVGTWLTLVGPHLDEAGLQVYPQRGALRGLVEHAHDEDLRVNLILPSRASSGDEALDRPLADAVLALATPALAHLRGNVLEVPLPSVPRLRVTEVNAR